MEAHISAFCKQEGSPLQMFTLANLFLLQPTDTEPEAKGRDLHWKQQVKWWQSGASSSSLHRSQRQLPFLWLEIKKEHKKILLRSIKALHLCNDHTQLHCKLPATCMQEISQTPLRCIQKEQMVQKDGSGSSEGVCSPQAWGKSSPMSQWQSLNTQWISSETSSAPPRNPKHATTTANGILKDNSQVIWSNRQNLLFRRWRPGDTQFASQWELTCHLPTLQHTPRNK